MKKKTVVRITSGAMVAMLTMNTLGMMTPVNAACHMATGSYSRIATSDQEIAEAIAASLPIPRMTRESLNLPTSVDGAKITYKSSNTKVLSNSGDVKIKLTNNDVTLTATVQYGKATASKDYTVTVFQIPQYKYGFNFSNVEGTKVKLSHSLGIMGGAFDAYARLKGDAIVLQDEKRGGVLQLTNEPGAKGENYLDIPGGCIGIMGYEGFTINMWVNPAEALTTHNALYEASTKEGASVARVDGKLNVHINANGTTCDITPNVTLKQNEWQFVTFMMDANGARIYLNGKLVGEEKKDLSACLDKSTNTCVQRAAEYHVGTGVLADDEDIQNAQIDDIDFYQSTLTVSELNLLYQKSK